MKKISIKFDKRNIKQTLFERMIHVGGMPQPITEENFLEFTRKAKSLDEVLDILEKVSSLSETRLIRESEGNVELIKDPFEEYGSPCLNPEVIVKWLEDEAKRLSMDAKDRGKKKDDIDVDPNNPDITDVHMGSWGNKEFHKFKNEEGSIDINIFIKNITSLPSYIFDANSKMDKSGKRQNYTVINTGIPALVGVVYDLKKNKFTTISTCPSAGSCLLNCYAREAFYEINHGTTMRLTQVLNLLFNNPLKYKQLAKNDIIKFALRGDGKKTVLRWNDAGDFFGDLYFKMAVTITNELINEGYDILSYAYTKRSKYALKSNEMENFIINFSANANKNDIIAIKNSPNFKTQKMGELLPMKDYKNNQIFKYDGPHIQKWMKPSTDPKIIEKKKHTFTDNEELWGKPIYVDEGAPERLKDIAYKKFRGKYGIERDSLKFTWELPDEDLKENYRKFNVIVLPAGDVDDGAFRNDVRLNINLEH